MEHFDEQQSLKLIEQMIENAKAEVRDDGFHYLLWGWLVLASSLIHFALLNFTDIWYFWLPWPVLMPMGGIIGWIYGWKRQQEARVQTYFDRVMRYLWGGFVIALLIFLFLTIQYEPTLITPSVMVLIGLATFVSGGCLKFKPLVIGGIFGWGMAIVGVLFPAWQLLLLALTVLVGYLVPGYILRRSYHEQSSAYASG